VVEPIPDLPENVAGFTASGTVTAEDYDSVIVPAVEKLFARHTKARFLYHLGEAFTGFEPLALWDDAKLSVSHITGWERVAIVTDVGWLRGAIRVFRVVNPAHVRAFHNSELAEAKRWVCE